jgi:hypothetical protein
MDLLAAATTIELFAIGIAASVLLIIAFDRPFFGQFAARPRPLLQVMPVCQNQ